ncbi:hypothetical protein HOD75_04570 [archaeon]|jgi:hypothetical protein|nr:hypothetical protein [archaeon]MBT4242139.1 hypothetical protein [archaeon]MBT4417827.1 hypothetical protein [archaeon]
MEIPKDHISQLSEYMEKNLMKGYPVDSLKFSLMSQGYSRISVDRAAEKANKRIAEQMPKMKEKPQIIRRVITDNEPIQITQETPQEKQGFFKKIFKR